MTDPIHFSEEHIPLPIPSEDSADDRLQSELVALNAISWALSQSLDLDRVLELALETTLRVMDSQAGSIHLPEEARSNELRLRVHTGLSADFAQCIETITNDQSEVQRIIASSSPVVTDWDDVLTERGVISWSRQDEQSPPYSSDRDTQSSVPVAPAQASAPGVWVSVPLPARSQLQGLMGIVVEELTPDRAYLLKRIGQHVGVAIENARLIEAERRQREVAEILRDLVVAVNSTLDVDQVLNLVVRRLQTLYQATACSVSFLEEEGETFVFRATTDSGIHVDRRITFPATRSIAGRAIRERKVQIVNDVDQSPDHRADIARRTGIVSRSVLTAPLFADDKPLGVIQVLSASPNAFTEADAELLTTTAALIETAVARAQTYAHAVQLAKAEHHQREVAETLRRVAILISASLDLDTVLGQILEHLAQVVDYDGALLMLLEDGKLTVRAIQGFEDPDLVLSMVADSADNPLFQEVLASRRPFVIPDICADDHYRHWAGTVLVCSWIGVPLVVRDRVIGQLAVDKDQPDFYDEGDAELVFTFAQQAAVAIENAQLFEGEQRQRQMAEALRQAGAALSSTLDYEEVLDRILEQVSQVVPHDAANIMLIEGDVASVFRWRGYAQFGSEDYIESLSFSIADTPNLRTMKETGQPLSIPYTESNHEWIVRAEELWLKSYAGAPICIRDRVIGFLSVDSATAGFFSQTDAERLQAFAQQAAIAIENAQLFEAEQYQRQMAEALHRAALTLTSTMALPQVFERILTELQHVVPYDSASVQLLKGDHLEIIGGRGFPNLSELLGVSFPARGDNPNTLVLESQEPVIIDDVSLRFFAFSKEPHAAADIHGWLGVPLLIGDQIIGMLALDKHHPGFYTEAHARAAMAYAAQAAIAVENARLYEEERERLAEMERRNRELVTLHAVAAAVSSSLDIEVVLRESLARALETIGMESGGVYLLDETENVLILRIEHDLPEKVAVEAGRLEMGDGFSGQGVQMGEPVVVEDLPHDPRLSRSAAVEAGYQTVVVVPLRAKDRIVGTFFSISRQPRQLSSDDLNLLVAIGDEMGVAVENAQLHQALQDYAAELEARVEARTTEVNRERERLLAVLESAGEAFVITNADGVIEYANPAWERLTGYDAFQAIQQKTRILDGETFPDLFATGRSITQGQRIWRREMIGKRPDGATYVADLTVTPVFGDATELANLVVIYRDVTQYKELDRIKSEFLSTAAHELRSPLTSILGFSELLMFRQDLSGEEQVRFLNYINDHALYLKQLVDDLLDVSRFEAGTGFAVELEPLDLYPLFEQEIRSWQEAHADHTYRLQTGSDPGRNGELPEGWPRVRADKDRVLQVMHNLLSNATKYSPGGGTITVSAIPTGGYMEVTVADEGTGMTTDELTHLFEKFWRADASSTAVEGTGLGLVIVKHIVEQHGGHIWVESVKGEGTIVYFTLPLVEHQMTVLIVEDEEPVCEIEKRILTRDGLATLIADHGQAAIELAHTYRPDLILLDLMMPDMSGKEVMQALKAHPTTRHIPVVVVSARSSWQAIEEMYLLGVIDFLTKPFEYQELLSRVRRALKMTRGVDNK